ncbi:hypothetical protein Asulf_00663 [Archaeoglobus sulfaticallidus PM70-1]|uniref:Uncharacterized protein n=1 Tax=Archaeoglobus sulfaticallidus PM70-1 TaxID=387631 RepID=N0BJL7_9EURY|nr:hypothetical protein [Archaeoglobus sulfaticallidus]AGK60681.1 hypothetical protein Asulf_00663 [Archaeoglobus sulfaticallidus PM70-1]
MRKIFWLGMADEKKIDYLEKFSVAIIGSRMLMEILWRSGVGCIRYIGDFVTPVDARLDSTIKPLEANDYDVVHPMSFDSCVISYPYPEEYSELKKQLKGIDVIIAHKHIRRSARIAEELGVPFIPEIITTFLPDGISFFDVRYDSPSHNPISYAITCSIQAGEVMRIFTGYELPTIAPEAYVVDFNSPNYLRKIDLQRMGD